MTHNPDGPCICDACHAQRVKRNSEPSRTLIQALEPPKIDDAVLNYLASLDSATK